MVAAFDPTTEVSAASVAQRFTLSDDARALLKLDARANVRRYLDQLVGSGLPADALALVARVLPKRYVVAWACDCFKTALANDRDASDIDRAGLALAQQWLSEPTEDHRRAALDFAERGEFGTPGAWIAASAGWTGGSLLPRGYDTVAPPDHLPAEAAIAALRLTAARGPDYAGAINGFVTRAIQIFGPAVARSGSETGGGTA
ncbi:MAG TPA: hypothetical protein VGD45_30440 [Steroidobacter sp.]|uniref:DUF6931 family protein n=1 Tax=Steroidobacter sp. TaxID=1978227 RepID=UPI002ED91F86